MSNQKGTTTVRALRMNSLRSDGTPNTDLVRLEVKDPRTGEVIRNDDDSAAVIVNLRPMTPERRAAIVQEHTRLEKSPNGGRGLFEVVDERAAALAVLCEAIQSWTGLVGCDDKALACTAQTKVLLDAHLNLQITQKLFGAEAVEVSPDSFR